ncbi:MAG TPA: hypothetical protein VLZ31_02050 [Microbacteriaceae bacterium]|nr:hypothetical protein [Microbacteriaceae bacterium]
MNLVTRILTAVGAVIAGLFIASPALAAEPHVGTSQYSTAGGPLDVVAVTIVMVVLLIVVLASATGISNLFEKKN